MARKPKDDIAEDDMVWVLARVTLDRTIDGEYRHLTVELPNGHRATLLYKPEQIIKAEME